MSSTIIIPKDPLQPIKTRPFRLLLGVIFATLIAGLVGDRVYAADPNVLEAVDIRTLPGNRIQLRFQLSQPAERPRTFTINDPARLVLDFLDTKNGLSDRGQDINKGAVETLTVLEGGDRTRASVNLARMVPYSIRAKGNNVLLTLEAAGGTSSISVSPEAAAPLGPQQIGNVDFRRGSQGEAVIGIKMSDPAIPVDVRQEGTRIVVDFVGAEVPRNQERRLDVTDFATPVTLIDVLNKGNDARVEIQPTGHFEFLAYQAEDVYTVEVRPIPEELPVTADTLRERRYTGEPLSLNFQDIEVRAVLQILADFTGLNVVVSDSVKGNLTLRLQSVPWDQALDIILRTKGLTQRQNGNVIYIAPTEEVTAREKLELEARKQVVELVPLRTELVQVNYAKAEDLAKLIEEKKAVAEGQKATSLLSERGNVSVDVRTNTLIVQDVPENISEIRDLVTQLDKPVRQVIIDSRVVVANEDFSKELGVRYGFAGVDRNGDQGITTLSGSLTGTDTVVNSAIGNLQQTGQPFPTTLPSLDQRLGVNLPVGGPTSRLALAVLGRDYLVDLELSALQAEGRGEVLSNPRVVTTDRKEAFIKEGREIPFQTVGADGVPVTAFKDAKLELTVTPQITPDGRVIMDLRVKQDEIGDVVFSGIQGSQLPTIDTREVTTQVLVDNGETVVLGGVFIQTVNRNLDKVPLLGDIPVLGRLFQRRTQSDNKRELLIFVTPQIVTGQGIATAQ